MSLLFIEGFDTYGAIGDVSPGKWDTAVTTGMTIISPGRLGVFNAMRMGISSNMLRQNLGTPVIVIWGAAIRLDGVGDGSTIVEFRDSGSVQVKAIINSSNQLELQNSASAVLATSTTVFTIGVYAYVEIKVTIDNSTGAVEAEFDESADILTTSIDTQNTANAYVNEILVRGQTNNITYDDMYILDTLGAQTHNKAFLGDSRIDPFFPDADGTTSDWGVSSGVNHWELVDENPPDGDATYIFSDTLNEIDLFEIEDTPAGAGTIHGIQIVGNARKIDAGARNIRLKAISGATTQNGASQGLATTYANYIELFETSDGTTTAWTTTTVDAAKIGVEVI